MPIEPPPPPLSYKRLSYKRRIGYRLMATALPLFLIIALLETIGPANFRSGVNRVKQVVPVTAVRAIS